MDIETVKAFLWALHRAQQTVWEWLGALGLLPLLHGQPEWPFAQRLAAEQLLFDHGQARRLMLSLGAIVCAVVLLLLAIAWRRARRWLFGLGVLLLLVTPWPQWSLLTVSTTPTSFHQSPTAFGAASIVQGQALYATYCLRCHGTDGSGEGPEAANLPMWPPTLNGKLMWARTEGELFWRVRYGLRDAQRRETMPGTALGDAQVWAVLDFVRAQAAGQTLRRTGAWTFPVRMPEATVHCLGRDRYLTALRGQRVRLALNPDDERELNDDPRLVTVSVGTPSTEVDCYSTDPLLETALGVLIGVAPAELSGYSLIADRDGWLRVRGRPGLNWSSDDLVCKADARASSQGAAIAESGEGIDALIRRMDREPVRQVSGGFPH